jgi:HPt (histidine-containing phosphotransfer) domain-containing protein
LLRDFADLALPICVASDATVRSELKGRIHKLRGSAGVIGATQVMRLAREAEKALENDCPADIVDGLLRQLAMALILLREEADLNFARDPERVAGTDTEPGNRSNASIDFVRQ